jgi:hypothetical protein
MNVSAGKYSDGEKVAGRWRAARAGKMLVRNGSWALVQLTIVVLNIGSSK